MPDLQLQYPLILQALVLLGALAGVYNKISNRLSIIETTLNPIVERWKKCIEGDCPVMRVSCRENYNKLADLEKSLLTIHSGCNNNKHKYNKEIS